jgi:hypothetical protein
MIASRAFECAKLILLATNVVVGEAEKSLILLFRLIIRIASLYHGDAESSNTPSNVHVHIG